VATADRLARGLTLASGAVFLVFGAISFLLPNMAAENFPWGVSPFVAMTIGAWAIGAGLIALDCGYRWNLTVGYAGLVLVWVFSLLELLVVVQFLAALRTDHWLTWPYLLALVLGLAGGVFGAMALYRQRAAIREPGERIPTWVWLLIGTFIVLVGFLAVGLTLRSGTEPGQTLFPEPLTLFTVRAFAAFFASLVVSAIALLASRDLRAPIDLARVGLYLVIPITIASLANVDKFDFGAKPGGLVYIGAYILTAGLALFSVWWFRSRRSGAGT
jgi:hypothetical protein